MLDLFYDKYWSCLVFECLTCWWLFCIHYKSIHYISIHEKSIHYKSIQYKSIVHNYGMEWSGELSNTPVSTALCDAVTHDTATALLTSSHSRYVSHYIIGIFVQFFPFLQAHTRVATTKKGWKRVEGVPLATSVLNKKDRAWSELPKRGKAQLCSPNGSRVMINFTISIF